MQQISALHSRLWKSSNRKHLKRLTLIMDEKAPKDPSKVTEITLKSGCPISDKLNSLSVGPKGPLLLADATYLEETAHFNRERIPERVVHAKGVGAFGSFKLTSSEIGDYCKAALFAEANKETPVVVRFSHVTGESGIPDPARDFRGFSVKFYTEQGNWDIVGNNFPVFFIRDPINFSSFIHSQKRHPKTHMKDPNAFWDFVSMRPESVHAISMLFSERGIPDGFRHMHGYGVNTFRLVNKKNESFFAKFHWICNQNIRNLDQSEADKIAGLDPDYFLRDFQVNIETKHYPSWTLKFQVISQEAAEKVNFNIFDCTKVWPTADFPLKEVGKMTLDRLVENYFAQTEQLAMSPANLVPGIEASPDKMLVGRIMSYPDAQRYRLGVNYTDLPVNQPKCPVMTPTYNDGANCTKNAPSSLPNYLPSIYYKNVKMQQVEQTPSEFQQHFEGRQARYDLSNDDNFSQVRALICKVLSASGRSKLVSNLAEHLSGVSDTEIVNRVLNLYKEVDATFAKDLEDKLKEVSAK